MIDLRMQDQDAVSRCEFCGNQYGDDRCGCDAAKDGEITTLRAQLEEARAKAINACIKIADNHAVMADSCIEKGAAEMIAVDLRALLHGSTK